MAKISIYLLTYLVRRYLSYDHVATQKWMSLIHQKLVTKNKH